MTTTALPARPSSIVAFPSLSGPEIRSAHVLVVPQDVRGPLELDPPEINDRGALLVTFG